jgi:hypothetical protein
MGERCLRLRGVPDQRHFSNPDFSSRPIRDSPTPVLGLGRLLRSFEYEPLWASGGASAMAFVINNLPGGGGFGRGGRPSGVLARYRHVKAPSAFSRNPSVIVARPYCSSLTCQRRCPLPRLPLLEKRVTGVRLEAGGVQHPRRSHCCQRRDRHASACLHLRMMVCSCTIASYQTSYSARQRRQDHGSLRFG